jgi:thioredoxin 1
MKDDNPKKIALKRLTASLSFMAVVSIFLYAAATPSPCVFVATPPAQNANSSAASAVSAKPYDEKADAAKDISAALRKARSDHKRILIDFGANWCPDCVVLSKIIEDESVKTFLDDNFYVVKVDVGRFNKNLDIANKYGNPIGKGIPAVVVLDPGEKIIASTSGGELANARTATAQEILNYLKSWAPQR